MAKDSSNPAPSKANGSDAVKPAEDKTPQRKETLYIIPNFNSTGKTVRVYATDRESAIAKATAEAKKGQK